MNEQQQQQPLSNFEKEAKACFNVKQLHTLMGYKEEDMDIESALLMVNEINIMFNEHEKALKNSKLERNSEKKLAKV